MSTERIDTLLTATAHENKPLDSIPDFDLGDTVRARANVETNAEIGTTDQAGPLSAVKKQVETSETLSVESSRSSDGRTPSPSNSEVDAEAYEGPSSNFRPRGRGDKPVVGKPKPSRPR